MAHESIGNADYKRLSLLLGEIDREGIVARDRAVVLTQEKSKTPERSYINFVSRVNSGIKVLLDEIEDDYEQFVFENLSLSHISKAGVEYLQILAKVPQELSSTVMPNLTYDTDMFIDSSGVSNQEILIFISYASGDLYHKNIFVERLEKQLKKNKISFNLKIWEMKEIPIGVDFDQNIRDNLAECDYGFTLLSDNFIQSQYIMDIELPILLESDKIFPIGLVGSMSSIVSQVDNIKKRKQKSNAKELLNRNIFMLKNRVGHGDFFSTCAEKSDQKLFVDELLNSLSHRKSFDTPKKKLFCNHTVPDKRGIYEEEEFFDQHRGKLSEIYSAVEKCNEKESKKEVGVIVKIQEDMREWLWNSKKYPQSLYALLGDFGMGKTFNLRMFTMTLWQKYQQNKESIIPFYIDLRDVDSFIHEDNRKRVPYIEEMIAEILRQSNNSDYNTKEIIALHKKGALLLLIDGLDEKLVHYDKEQQDKFLKELMMAISPQHSNISKTILSCRNHYFETAIKQNNFLLGKGRVGTKSSHYVALDILPLDRDEVKAFLSKRLSKSETDRVLLYISNDEYLGSIASRPFMLSKILELLPYLLEVKESGKVLNIASFYDALVTDTFARDEDKNKIDAYDKVYILKKLAYYMYIESMQSISINELNKWFLALIREDEYLAEYRDEQKEILKQDLRNSTLLVRFGEDDFGFSHSSIYEYFLSQYALEHWKEIAGAKELSTLSRQFLLDMAVNLKENDKKKLLPKLVDCLNISISNEKYWVKLSLDLLSFLNLRIVHLKIEYINLEHYHFKNLNIEHCTIKNSSCNHSHFINCTIKEFIIEDTDFYECYFEDTDVRSIDKKTCNWKNITLLNSELDLNFPIKHDYTKVIKDRLWFLKSSLYRSLISVNSVSFSPDGLSVISSSMDNTLKLWSLKGECLATFNGHSNSVTSVSFSPDGLFVISGSNDRTLKLWNLQGECLATFEGHSHWISSVSFSPDGLSVISGSGDNSLRLWNLNGECLATFKGHKESVTSLSFSPDGLSVISGSGDNSLRLWNLNGGCLTIFKGHDYWVNSVSFSPDGFSVISSSMDKTLKLWDFKGECLATLNGNSNPVRSVNFSPDGFSLILGSNDKTLKLWNLKGECLSIFKGHSDYVNSVSFSPDGKTVLSGSSDGTTRLWDIETKKEIAVYVHKDREWYSLDFQNQTAKGTPMSWKLSTLTDKNGETFTIDKLKGFEVRRYNE